MNTPSIDSAVLQESYLSQLVEKERSLSSQRRQIFLSALNPGFREILRLSQSGATINSILTVMPEKTPQSIYAAANRLINIIDRLKAGFLPHSTPSGKVVIEKQQTLPQMDDELHNPVDKIDKEESPLPPSKKEDSINIDAITDAVIDRIMERLIKNLIKRII